MGFALVGNCTIGSSSIGMLISHLVRQFPIHHLNADAALLHVVHLILHLLLHHEVEQGKRRNPYRENEPVRRRERDRLLRYLSLHKMGSRSLTTQQGDTLNSIVASFLVVWRRNGWIAKDFSGRTAWRFLHDDCGIASETTQQSYANKIKEWVNGKKYSIETLADVEDFVRKS